DQARATINVNVVDDVPVAGGTAVHATLDEDDIAFGDTVGTHPWDGNDDGSFTILPKDGVANQAYTRGTLASTVDFGADGSASTAQFAFTADAVATFNALGLQSGGVVVQFKMVGDTLVGYKHIDNGSVDGQDYPVLSLALDPATGAFVYSQFSQLDHVHGNGENTKLQLENGSIDALDFGRVISARDGDGDTVSLSGKFTITVRDDVPDPQITPVNGAELRIDESAGKQDSDSTSSSLKSLFSKLRDIPEGEMGAQYARTMLLEEPAGNMRAGADGLSKGAYTLKLTSTSPILDFKTTDGQEIRLKVEMVNGQSMIVGRVINHFGSSGDAAFAIHLDDQGQVSVAQFMPLDHPDTGNPDDSLDLTGLVEVKLDVTDGDGDHGGNSLQIGHLISFDDDGPSLDNLSQPLQVDEDDLPNGSDGDKEPLVVRGDLQLDFGADGAANDQPLSFDVPVGLQSGMTSAGVTLFYSLSDDGSSLTATAGEGGPLVFSVELDASQQGYTFTLHGPLDHGAAGEDVLGLGFDIIATDGDG
ncbi:DUF5801 repeats-in-toxin domain-containing protein, partial [Polycladidibacter stylochi]|uniref:DUF5801 repeats-in-toxin domain-containing protein n=1 Tax=Polycladidibacter stylochi TaxID=1807766 RepID=UPI001AD921AC